MNKIYFNNTFGIKFLGNLMKFKQYKYTKKL